MPVLPTAAARVFCDGIFGAPRLSHPEGVAIHPDGSVWCGTDTGELLRIAADGSSYARIGGTGGFALGLALDAAGNAYVCDLMHRSIWRWHAASATYAPFAGGGILVPNYPVIDPGRNALYVSDSRGEGNPGPGIWRYDLTTGLGGPWSAEADWDFANGMCLDEAGSGLYVIESFRACVRHVPIRPDGSAGPSRVVLTGMAQVLDGLALAPDGTLYISCYEPGRIYRRTADKAGVEVLIEDRNAVVLAHPTNMALKGERMYTANLGRWHVTEIDLRAGNA